MTSVACDKLPFSSLVSGPGVTDVTFSVCSQLDDLGLRTGAIRRSSGDSVCDDILSSSSISLSSSSKKGGLIPNILIPDVVLRTWPLLLVVSSDDVEVCVLSTRLPLSTDSASCY